MTRTARAALVVLTLVALAFAGAAGVRAADPTLGATIQSRVYLDQGGDLLVWNRSTVLATFTFEAAGGWVVEPAAVVLDPDEQAVVVVSGRGEDGSPVDVRVSSVAPVPAGAQRSEIVLTARIFYEAPFDPWPWLLGGLAVLAILAGTGMTLRRFRPWELRLARKP